jgi:anaphase-promoting complex subunit 4
MDGVTEKVGMLIVQVERFSRVAATVLYLVFFFSCCVFCCFYQISMKIEPFALLN